MQASTQKIACIGEIMVEVALLADEPGKAQLGFGGDTGNTAIYLARLLSSTESQVAFASLLGDDSFSCRLKDYLAGEQVDCHLLKQVKGQEMGLYSIEVNNTGERNFHYWRANAPVKDLYEGSEGLKRLEALEKQDVLFYSAITLAVLNGQGRSRLIDFARQQKKGGKTIVFDSNYRARLWQQTPAPEVARIIRDALESSSIALPSIDDLRNIFGKTDPELKIMLDSLDVGEVVIKRGGAPLDILQHGKWHSLSLEKITCAVDTTAAGDSFNAGYIAARIQGLDAITSALQAHKLASCVLGFPGAIIPRNKMPAVETIT